MLLQYVVRGLSGLDVDEVRRILGTTGLVCAAVRMGGLDNEAAEGELGPDNLERHLHDFAVYGADSPYVSTSAGMYIGGTHDDPDGRQRLAIDTALDFGVVMPGADGWLFFGYTFLLGRPASRHAEFGEEVRDVNQWPRWSRYREEGEVAVPIRIPPRRLAEAQRFSYRGVMEARSQARAPQPESSIPNDQVYRPPESVLSAREVI